MTDLVKANEVGIDRHSRLIRIQEGIGGMTFTQRRRQKLRPAISNQVAVEADMQ